MNEILYLISVIYDDNKESKTPVGIFNEECANKVLEQLKNTTPRYGTIDIDVEPYVINEVLFDFTGI